MTVTALLDRLGTHLGPQVAAAVGVVRPATPATLPAVTLSLPVVEVAMPSVGRQSDPPQHGALRVERELDLADPALEFDAERVVLVSGDRRTLQLPHGPVVRADGSDLGPFTASDLTIDAAGTAYTPMPGAGAPTGNRYRVDPQTGVVSLGNPLPGAGTLRLVYFVGQWEVRAERYAGALQVDTYAGTPASTVSISNQVLRALADATGASDGVTGLRRLDPSSVGAVVGTALAAPGDAHERSLTYRFDFESIEPILPTGGGPIGRVAVISELVNREIEPGVLGIDPSSHEGFEVLEKGSAP